MKKLAAYLALALIVTGCASTPRRDVVYTDRGYASGPVYVQPAPMTTQQDTNRKILMQGVTGAAVGAISAEASGGKAGTGALVGAGTNVLGSALVDVLTTPSQPQQVVYAQPANQGYVTTVPQQRKVLRKFDSNGNIVSEEETLP